MKDGRKGEKLTTATSSHQTKSEINKIRKNQIDTQWQYAKAETEIHCKKFIQIFIILLTIGFTIIITTITGGLEPLFNYVAIGLVFICLSFYSIIKVNELTKLLRNQMIRIHSSLENLK